MPCLGASVSPSSFLNCDIKTFFFLVLMFANEFMLLICVLYLHLSLQSFVVSDSLWIFLLMSLHTCFSLVSMLFVLKLRTLISSSFSSIVFSPSAVSACCGESDASFFVLVLVLMMLASMFPLLRFFCGAAASAVGAAASAVGAGGILLSTNVVGVCRVLRFHSSSVPFTFAKIFVLLFFVL